MSSRCLFCGTLGMSNSNFDTRRLSTLMMRGGTNASACVSIPNEAFPQRPQAACRCALQILSLVPVSAVSSRTLSEKQFLTCSKSSISLASSYELHGCSTRMRSRRPRHADRTHQDCSYITHDAIEEAAGIGSSCFQRLMNMTCVRKLTYQTHELRIHSREGTFAACHRRRVTKGCAAGMQEHSFPLPTTTTRLHLGDHGGHSKRPSCAAGTNPARSHLTSHAFA